jgi:Na+-driven multidrug efflux pump
MIGFSLMWVALSLKGGLAAVPIWTAVSACSSFWWVTSGNTLLQELSRPKDSSSHRMNWRTEIFPLQWRIAVSWISGYFIFQTFTPLVFAHQGAVEAGRFGVALTIFSSLSALGMSWVNASASQMGQYVSRGERNQLNALFKRVSLSSTLFTFSAGLCFLLFVWGLRCFGVPVAQRIASLPIIACLALVSAVNAFINGAAVYMRAHKQEPMLAPSVVGGIITFAFAYFGSMVNALLPVVLWALSTVLIGLPWAMWLFIPFYRRKT